MNDETMSDEHLNDLRERAFGGIGFPPHVAREVVAEVDRLRAALSDAERMRDEWSEMYKIALAAQVKAERACKTLGKVIEDQCRDALSATGLHRLIDETGDGDWGAVWENVAELGERARRAEAALARVTDDSMAERIRDELAHTTIGSGYYQTSVATDEAAEMAEWVLAEIRAVAAGEQTEGDER